MGSRLLKLILLISLLFNISIVGAAGYFYLKESWCGVFPDGTGKKGMKLAKRLELTPEQRKIIEEEDARLRKALEETRAELIRKRNQLFNLLKEDSPDRDSIKSLLSEISALQARTEAQVVEHLLNEKATLTKEQQAKYIELLERRLKRIKPHRGR